MVATALGAPFEVVAGLAPLIREYQDESESAATLARPVVDALIAANLFRQMVPASLGGGELNIRDWFRTVEAAARIDGSVGWCLFINGSGGMLGRALFDADAEAIMSAPGLVIAGSVYPFNPAEAAAGGYRVSARWPFASGCKHASHIIAFCMVHEDGSPRVGPAGPEIRIMLVPAEEVSIVETWDSVGLVATGSHDIVFEDVFVPEPRAIPLGPMPSNRHYQGPLYRLPYMALFAWPIAAVALGIAQHAIDIATELAATKVSAGATARSAERPVFQLQLADAVAGVRSGRAWLYEALAELEAIAADGGHAGLPERANAQLAVSNAVRNARAATDLMFLAAGTSALARTGELQRCLRDIHAVSQHVASGPGTWEGMGAILAGGPAQNPLLLL